MNAGLATAAPQPLPTGPQPSVAPGASTAVTKSAGEAFSLHLAKATAAKAPVKSVPAQQSADQVAEPTADQPAMLPKADNFSAKTEPKDAASKPDEALGQVASLNGSDPVALVLLAMPVAVQAEASPVGADVQANLQVTSAVPQTEAAKAADPLPKATFTPEPTAPPKAGLALDPKSAELHQAQQAIVPDRSAAPNTNQPQALDAQSADPESTTATQVEAQLQATTVEPRPDTFTSRKALADVALRPSEPATPEAGPVGELVTAGPNPAQQSLTQASIAPLAAPATKTEQPSSPQAQVVQSAIPLPVQEQANLSQVVAQQGASPEAVDATPTVAAKSAPASVGKGKSADLASDPRTSKSEIATASDMPTPPSGMILASSPKSGGSGAGSDLPGHEFERTAAPTQATDGASALAASSDVPQPLLQAPVHIAPQTLQTAALLVKSGPQTVASLAGQIVSKFDGKTTRFDVELHPLDLGRVDVRLEVGAGGQISAAMSFDNPQAASDMRARSADLQKALENAGFNLSGGLSFDVAGGRGQGSGRNSGAEPGPAQRVRALETATSAAAEAADTAMTNLMSAYGARPSRSVDIRI